MDTFWVHYALKWAEGFQEQIEHLEQSKAQEERLAAYDAAVRLRNQTAGANTGPEGLEGEGGLEGAEDMGSERHIPLSNLELLHARDKMPDGLQMQSYLPASVSRRWEGAWERMAAVLADSRLAELTDVPLVG